MIKGTKYWNDPKTFHIQDNNVFEESFRKKKITGWLETCGPTSCINAICSMKGPDYFDNLMIGNYAPQPEDLLTLFLNDYRNYNAFKKIRADVNPSSVMCNEIPQYYSFAVKQLFGVDCEFKWEKDWDKLINYLLNGQAVQICEPKHYTCAVAYDDEKNTIIYNDPWNKHYKTSGFNRRYSKEYYDKSIEAFVIVFK